MPAPEHLLSTDLIRRWHADFKPAHFDEVIEQIQKAYARGLEHGRLPLIIAERMESELPQGVFDSIVEYLKADKLINAIKVYRDATKAPLKEAKDAVERLRDNLGLTRDR